MSAGQRYVEAVNNADSKALLALFAEDAEVKHPVGIDQGHEEIVDFHTEVIFADENHANVIRGIQQGNVEVLQLQVVSPIREDEPPVDMVNIFTYNDDGLIQHIDIYYR